MKNLKMIFTLILFVASLFYAQEPRKVLVEVFTNSHCPLCPAAHNVLGNYLSGNNGDKINYIYFHMVYPYPDDLLYQQSMEGSDGRNMYYHPVPATPLGFFDGDLQGSSSGWNTTLNSLVTTESPLKIILSGTKNQNEINITAQLTRSGEVPDNDLVIHFVLVEDVYYAGRNGITNHKHVMRKMFPTPSGNPFTINLNQTKDIDQSIIIDPGWDKDSLSVVVFVQSTGSMTVYQSETIDYSQLSVTSVQDDKNNPSDYSLGQNYPNPFNPTTTIKFTIPVLSTDKQGLQFTSLKVYDVLGNEITTLVNEEKPSGSYEVGFNAYTLPSGIYFYKLETAEFIQTKKMILLK